MLPLPELHTADTKKMRDREWLLLSVCEDFSKHGKCEKVECCGAHCDAEKTAMDPRKKKVIVCFEHLKGSCVRAACHYYHASEEQKPQIIQRGRERQRNRREAAWEIQSLCHLNSALWQQAAASQSASSAAHLNGHRTTPLQPQQASELSASQLGFVCPSSSAAAAVASGAASISSSARLFGASPGFPQSQPQWGFYAAPAAPPPHPPPQMPFAFASGLGPAAALSGGGAVSQEALLLATNLLLAQGFTLAPTTSLALSPASAPYWPQQQHYLPLPLAAAAAASSFPGAAAAALSSDGSAAARLFSYNATRTTPFHVSSAAFAAGLSSALSQQAAAQVSGQHQGVDASSYLATVVPGGPGASAASTADLLAAHHGSKADSAPFFGGDGGVHRLVAPSTAMTTDGALASTSQQQLHGRYLGEAGPMPAVQSLFSSASVTAPSQQELLAAQVAAYLCSPQNLLA